MNQSRYLTEVAAPWKVAAASVVGQTHQQSGLPCQDAHAWTLLTDGSLVAAVADGTGAAAQPQIGSAIAVRTAINAAQLDSAAAWPDGGAFRGDRAVQHARVRDLAQQLYGRFLTDVLNAVNDAIKSKAADLKLPADELATTLVLTVVQQNCVITLQVGDGWTIVQDNDGSLLVNGTGPQHECINVTAALPHATPCKIARGWFLPRPVTHVALHTDGLQWVALNMPKWDPHRPFYSPIFQFTSEASEQTASTELETFLRSLQAKPELDDDLTLLVACREPHDSCAITWPCPEAKGDPRE